MKLFHVSPSNVSIFCASSAVPSVQVTSACVSPRVNTAEPCVRGSTPVSIQIGRISSNLRPSRRTPRVEHLVAQDLFLQLLEDRLRVGLPLDFAFGHAPRRGPSSTWSTRLVVLELVADAHRLGERARAPSLRPRGRSPWPISFFATVSFFLPASFARSSIAATICLIAACARLERLDDLLLGHFLRARFDHHEAVLAAGDDEVELALLALLEGRVDDVLAVDEADAHAGDRLLERNLRERERGRRAGDREHVGVVLRVGREHERDDLRLVAPAGREQRPDRPIDARGSSALPSRPACLRA